MTSLNSGIVRRLFLGQRYRRLASAIPFLRTAALLSGVGFAMGSDCLGDGNGGSIGTPGLLGNYSFWPDAPLASGGAQLEIRMAPLIQSAAGNARKTVAGPWVSVDSTDPAVLSAQVDPGTNGGSDGIRVRSNTAGTAELRLFDGGGQLAERFPITVKTPTELYFNDQVTAVLFAGTLASECPVAVAGQDRLLTGGTLHYSVTGTLTLQPEAYDPVYQCDPATANVLYPPVDQLWFTGTAGQGDVIVTTAEGLTWSRTWKVVTANDVASIHLATQNYTGSQNATKEIYLRATAFTKEGETITGPVCTWAAADPTVRIRTLDRTSPMRTDDLLDVVLPKAGSFAVTCTIGNAQATAQLM